MPPGPRPILGMDLAEEVVQGRRKGAWFRAVETVELIGPGDAAAAPVDAPIAHVRQGLGLPQPGSDSRTAFSASVRSLTSRRLTTTLANSGTSRRRTDSSALVLSE